MRKLHFPKIDGVKEIWKYIIGKSSVVIFDPRNKRYIVNFCEITGLGNFVLEKMIRKHSLRITPRMIKDYILKKMISDKEKISINTKGGRIKCRR